MSYIYETSDKTRNDKKNVSMKVYPNNQLEGMLKAGSLKIIELEKYNPGKTNAVRIRDYSASESVLENAAEVINDNFKAQQEVEPISADIQAAAQPSYSMTAETVPEPISVVSEEERDVGPDDIAAVAQMEPDVNNTISEKQTAEIINNMTVLEYEALDFPVISSDEGSSLPYINFMTFNRLGLTVRNLTKLLDSDEDFELNIIDCNSKDNSWDYIQSLTDRRIKSKTRFENNYGPIYAANYALSRRKPNQYFITVDSDTYIKTKNWISELMKVFNAFPELGILGVMRDNPYPRYLPPIIPRSNGEVSYLELKNANIESEMDFIPGQLQCLSPRLINTIGYWSEENGFGDAEISPRVVHYTDFKVGFITNIEIDMTQYLGCDECSGKEFCKLSRSITDCFSLSKRYNKNESFVEKNKWKFIQTFQELREGKRTAYCASIHDPESVKSHIYNKEWADENFNHYINNSN